MEALRKAQADGVVTDLSQVDNVGTRIDIDDMLSRNPNQFNLFVLALRSLMKDEEMKNIMSYYQIAGIHGLPLQPWDGVAIAKKTAEGSWEGPNRFVPGYCAHSTSTFPTWHRPYLAMLEQSLYLRMSNIAEQYAEQFKQSYRDAVKGFRLPFWDYFRPREAKETFFPGVGPTGQTSFGYDFRLPDIFTKTDIMVRTTPNNDLVSISNPFAQYKFPPVRSNAQATGWQLTMQGQRPFVLVPDKDKTQRYPQSSQSVHDINSVINQVREGNNEFVYEMMTATIYGRFPAVVSNEVDRSGGTSGSVEGLHNGYHGNIGGNNGSMSNTGIAAFDPVFWIHHCQIDRLFAIWQAIHPKEWFDPTKTNGTSDLIPFRYGSRSSDPKSQKFWKSNNCQDTKALGYVYAETAKGTPEEVKAQFMAKYNWQFRTARNPNPKCPPTMMPYPTAKAQVYQYGGIQAVTESVQKTFISNVTAAKAAVANVVPNIVGATKDSTSASHPNPPAAAAQPKAPAAVAAPTAKANIASQRVFRSMAESTLEIADPTKIDEKNTDRRWFIDNIVERLALNGSFTIYYFLGKFDDSNVNNYPLQPTLCGTSYNFAAPVEACDNCGDQAQQGQKVTDTTPITPILLDYVKIHELVDLSPASVKPFLIKNLKWRIVKADGTRIDPRSVGGLQVGVSSKLTNVVTGEVSYQDFPDIVEAILTNASTNASEAAPATTS